MAAKRGGKRPTGSSISPEVGAEILKALLTESPAPSQRQLAKRYGVSASSVQRYVKKNESVMKQVKQRPTAETVKAELVVAAIPQAVAEVRQLTRDLPITSLCKVMQAAESQYERYKDTDPQLAGGYLDQMRKCAVEMAKWLGIDKGIVGQDNEIRITVDWGDDEH